MNKLKKIAVDVFGWMVAIIILLAVGMIPITVIIGCVRLIIMCFGG